MRPWRSRSYLAALVGVGYTAFSALQSTDGSGAPWLALAVLPVALLFVWAKTQPPLRGVDPIEPAARSAARVTAAGTAMVLASWTGPAGLAWLTAAQSIGASMACIASLVSLARIASAPGLLQPPPATRRLDAVALASMLWAVAITLPLARTIAPEATTMLDPLSIDYATMAAATGGVGLMIVATLRVRAMRRLELGVADRASGALVLCAVTLATALPASILRVATPDRTMVAAVVVAGACVQFACVSLEPTRVARTMRVVLATALLAIPVGLAGVALSLRLPQSTGLLMLGVGGASVLVGLVAPRLARPLAPARSRWMEAIEKANEAALHPDPDIALRDALANVRIVLPGDSVSPSVFQVAPKHVLTVDRAGYVQTKPGEAPEYLYEVARGEPYTTVRTAVLQSLQVRRPDLRPIVQWLEARGLMSVTLMRDDDGPVGLLGLPRGRRRSTMSLEEVQATRQLADRVGAVLGVSSALARSRGRELELHKQCERHEQQIEQLQFQWDTYRATVKASARRLAEPLTAKVYSPAAAMALQQAQSLGAAGLPITLLTPPGVDPVPWAAIAHLESNRASGPIVVVDATEAVTHELDYWHDPATSPLCFADTGMLMVKDVQALPAHIQDYIASSLAQRVCPGRSTVALDLRLAVSVCATVDVLAASKRLSLSLADWLGESVLAIPPLASRVEDLRAIVLDQLIKIGTRLRRASHGEYREHREHRGMGIEDAALARLLEHTWPANELELQDVVLRAALVAKGDRITVEDLNQIGFTGPLPTSRVDEAPDPLVRKRSRRIKTL